MLEIWGRPTSICTQRVLWACVEAGIPFELTLASGTMGADGHVSTGARPYGTVDTPEYRAMNPNGTVPTIDDGGFVLWESNAILGYLARKYGLGTLQDGTVESFARALQWMAWTNEHLEPALHSLVMECSRLREDLRTPGASCEITRRITPALTVLDAHLSRHPFVAGDTLSLGDIPPAAGAWRWKVFGLDAPTTPHLDAWLAGLSEREGFKRHVAPRDLHV
jgi:glutathione S-transferase